VHAQKSYHGQLEINNGCPLLAASRGTAILSVLALIAFAANSLLTRMAIGTDTIDPTSFTVIRLVAGSLALWILVRLNSPNVSIYQRGNWLGAFALFVYAICFSFAYLRLEAGLGALVLFGAVQITLVTASVGQREQVRGIGWLGVAIAFAGLCYLLLDTEPTKAISKTGFGLMTLAGAAWGVYTYLGKGSTSPLDDTAGNFLKTLPFCLLALALLLLEPPDLSLPGVLLAIVAGAITSGVGYAIWYRALPQLKAIQAGVIQLTVPIIAALGGVLLLREQLTSQLLLSMVLTLGGIAIVIWASSSKT